MLLFLIARILQALPVLLTVALAAFCMFAFIGDPVVTMLGQDATPEKYAILVKEMGLDQHILVQFALFVKEAVQGDFGLSYRLSEPVGQLLIQRLPASLELAAAATFIALMIGVPAGIWTAIRPRSLLSRFLMLIGLTGGAIPTFVIGIMLIYIFAVTLGLLPSSGRGGVVTIGFWQTSFLTLSGLKSIAMPAVTLAVFQIALLLRLVNAEMTDALRSEYVRFARSRGLAERSIYFRHALRNTMVPLITAVGLQVGNALAFAIVTETVFQWPGIGLLFMQSISFADIPVISAYLVLIALIFVTLNIAVDLVYYLVDPRIRKKGR